MVSWFYDDPDRKIKGSVGANSKRIEPWWRGSDSDCRLSTLSCSMGRLLAGSGSKKDIVPTEKFWARGEGVMSK